MAVLDRASSEHIEGAARSMREFTCQPDLAGLNAPSILICGDRDRHVPLRNHLATQQAIPRCGLQVYFDVGHVPFVETPESLLPMSIEFLATLDLTSRLLARSRLTHDRRRGPDHPLATSLPRPPRRRRIQVSGCRV